ncbi:STAS-like domain-containing protein [Paenibacillus filicis]|uniref:STAS-like domain-containing protein n=1 Tax=Paenibacillus filicis TaxID=669464 RepID=A0ABU9DIF3_9BACL
MIRVLDHVDRCYSNSDGDDVRSLIFEQFETGTKTTISFDGVDSVSSSFINSAFIDLLDQYSFDYIRQNLSFIDSTKSINELIKKRFSFEVNERNKLLNV